MYDIRDILRKAIDITEKKKSAYLRLQENSGDIRMRLLIGVLIRSANKDIGHYKKIMENITDAIAETIDFSVFDKISSLVNQFARTITPIHITERKVLMEYALNQEKAIYALLVDIQGRMVVSDTTTSIAYYVLLEIIDDKRKFIEELETMLR